LTRPGRHADASGSGQMTARSNSDASSPKGDWRRFGPNGRAVIALLERVSRMTAVEATGLLPLAKLANHDAPRFGLMDMAIVLAEEHRPSELLVAREGTLGAMRVARSNYSAAPSLPVVWETGWRMIELVVEQAVVAVVVRDLLPAEAFGKLYEPWRRAIGEPGL
jgi:hypothetical protein